MARAAGSLARHAAARRQVQSSRPGRPAFCHALFVLTATRIHAREYHDGAAGVLEKPREMEQRAEEGDRGSRTGETAWSVETGMDGERQGQEERAREGNAWGRGGACMKTAGKRAWRAAQRITQGTQDGTPRREVLWHAACKRHKRATGGGAPNGIASGTTRGDVNGNG